MRHFNKTDIRNYIVEKTDKFIKRLCKKVSWKYDKFYGNEADVTKVIKGYVNHKLDELKGEHNIREIKASEIGDGNVMVYAAVSRDVDVIVDMDEVVKAEWVDVDKELPDVDGFYTILTDDYLARGFAYYGICDDSDDERRFDVWWAESGQKDKVPGVKYWLKDHHWGLVYDFKLKKGEIQ